MSRSLFTIPLKFLKIGRCDRQSATSKKMQLKGRITIYSITGCHHCKAAKSKLDEMHLGYTEVNLDENPEYRLKVIELTGKRTVPQIFFNGHYVGGNDDLQALAMSELDELIAEVRENSTPESAPPVPEKYPGRITLYSISGCPHCRVVKNKFEDLNLPFTEVNMDDNPHFRKPVMKLSGKRTLPQIFFNNIHVGGIEEFRSLSKEELLKLINEIKTKPVPKNAPPIPAPTDASSLDGYLTSTENDDDASLIHLFKRSGIVKDHRNLLVVHKNSFLGSELVSWIQQHQNSDSKQAFEFAQGLFQSRFLCGVHGDDIFKNDKTLYRLLEDEPSKSLNAQVVVDVKPLPASELAVHLRKQILKLYGQFLSSDGKCVDYKGMKDNQLFQDYVKLTGQLQRSSVEGMTRDEKLAFFINIYNALVIHGNVSIGIPTTTWQRYKFFNSASYRIGGLDYSLQDIENGILRSNRKGVGMVSRPFSKSDPRLRIALEEHEPLIHFALVCGARSCPPIKTYSPDGIMEQLRCAAEAFLEGDDGCSVDPDKKLVKLSKIMDWYKVDFGANNVEVVEWVCKCLPASCEKKSQLSKLIDGRSYKVSFMPYDWGTNSKPQSKS